MRLREKALTLLRLWLDKSAPKVFSFHDCLPGVFSEYLELLIYKRYRILSASELLDHRSIKARGGRGRDVALTFDDGRRNCWTVIFPLLKKYKIKASIFVIPERVGDSEEDHPSLEDYWRGKVSWENLYVSHKKQPYLTWKELKAMNSSGLVEIYSHSLRHDVVSVGPRIIDFQHPGVYEIPVYFDEWYNLDFPPVDSEWGKPVYERAWSPLASNAYCPDPALDVFMNDFVKKSGGFLFFRKKNWRQDLFDYCQRHRRLFSSGYFRKAEQREDLENSIDGSKRKIEEVLKNECLFFSLPLYQGLKETASMLKKSGYRAVFTGQAGRKMETLPIQVFNRIPGFWIKFLTYF